MLSVNGIRTSVTKILGYNVKKLVRCPGLWFHDRAANRRYATADRRVLVVRHGGYSPHFYAILLDWLAHHFPHIRARFELHQLPCRVRDWSRYVLHIPWLQDPVQQWSLLAYTQANELAEECDRWQIPIANRVDKLINATKSNGSRIFQDLGIRTPKMTLIKNIEEFKETLCGMTLPIIVREDWGHGRPMVRAERMSEVKEMQLEGFARPVAVEFIDTQSRFDALYHKYRYVAAREYGIPQSMHSQKSWVVRGHACEFSDDIRDEEIAFISHPDPNHEILQRARTALELDFVAFDYSYDREGRMVVWEANPYPYLHFPKSNRLYRKAAVERVLAAMTRMYLQRAGLPVPSGIEEISAGYLPINGSSWPAT